MHIGSSGTQAMTFSKMCFAVYIEIASVILLFPRDKRTTTLQNPSEAENHFTKSELTAFFVDTVVIQSLLDHLFTKLQK